jgi:L-alanine-DL-glutamate epimerase-like enolase superfamily enzyme
VDQRTYDRLATLPVQVDGWSLEPHERATKGGLDRRTTVVAIEGAGHVGRGEDVTYDPALHDALAADAPELDLAGEYTLDDASARLDGVDLFPAGAPERETFRAYRRWAVESALLDLALGQAKTDLAGALDCEPEPVRFVVSTGLGDPPSAAPVTDWLDVDPGLSFKVDVTQPLPSAVCDTLVETGAVAAVDLKSQYGHVPDGEGEETPSWVGKSDPDPAFYREVLAAFPDVVVEDPAVTDATRPVLEPEAGRLAWDSPVHAVADFEALPLGVGWCNVKPSRFGTLERLFEFLDFAEESGLGLYGGGQYELSVGRGQLHALASLFYPRGPSDIAPRPYNDPEPRAGLPASPLAVPAPEPGFGWGGD